VLLLLLLLLLCCVAVDVAFNSGSLPRISVASLPVYIVTAHDRHAFIMTLGHKQRAFPVPFRRIRLKMLFFSKQLEKFKD
jgi:hypothetical protein